MQFSAALPSTLSLTVLSMSFALSACGGGSGGSDDASKSLSGVTPTITTAEAPASASSASAADAAASAVMDAASQPSASAQGGEASDVSVQQQVSSTTTSTNKGSSASSATAPTPDKVAADRSTPVATPPTIVVNTPNAAVAEQAPQQQEAPDVNATALAKTAAPTTATNVVDGAVAAAAPLTSLVSSALVAAIDSTKTFASDNWLWTLECAGKVITANSIPELGVMGKAYGSSTLIPRFSKVTDPLNSSRKVLNFTVNRDDPLIAGAPRCEIGYSPTQAGKLPTGKEFWYGFGLYLPGWAATSDEQIVAQWQTTGTTTPLHPPLAVSVVGNALRVVARNGSGLSKSTAGTPILLTSSGLPTSAWTYIVIKARVSYTAGVQPYMQIWRDGVKIADSKAPVAYNLPGAALYAKFGHYHWIDASNPWPAATPSRTLLHRAPITVVDNSGVYTERDIRGFLMRN